MKKIALLPLVTLLASSFAVQAESTEAANRNLTQNFILAGEFWIAEITGPFDPDEYQTSVDEGERERWDSLEDYSEEDFLEILHSEDIWSFSAIDKKRLI